MNARSLTALALTLLLAAPAVAQEEAPPPPAAPAVAPAAPAAAPVAMAKKYLSPGIIEVGGGISLGFTDTSYTGGSQQVLDFGLTPYVLYYVMKGLGVGGRFTVAYEKQWIKVTGQPDQSSDSTGIAIQPAAEYHFDLGSRLYPYAGLALGYGYADYGSGKDNQMVFNIGGGVKMTFGGGILGLGLEVPIIYHSIDNSGTTTHATTAGFNIFTRYAVWF